MLIPSFTASTIRSTANNFLIFSPGENKGGSGKLCMHSSFSGIRGHNMHHKVKTFCMAKGSLRSFEKIKFTSLFYRAKPFGKGISSRSVPVGKRLDSNLFCAALRGRKKKTRRMFFRFSSYDPSCTRKIPATATERLVCRERNFQIGLQIGMPYIQYD